MATASRLFVRNSTGLVRSASAVDATIFNAVISAPVGSTIAYSIFFALVAFPGADVVGVLILVAIINIPVLIMFALLGASMPRVGGDYVWVSRVLSPPLALISNLCMIMGGLLGAAFFAKFFSVLALGPVLVALGCDSSTTATSSDWGTSFQTNNSWILGASLFMVLLQTLILDQRHQGDVPLAELLVHHRDGRHAGRVHRAPHRQPGRLLLALRRAQQELWRRQRRRGDQRARRERRRQRRTSGTPAPPCRRCSRSRVS